MLYFAMRLEAYQQGYSMSVSGGSFMAFLQLRFSFSQHFSLIFPAYLYSLHKSKTVTFLTNDIHNI